MPNSDGSAPGQLKRAVWLGSGLLGFTLLLTAVLCGSLFEINHESANYQPPLAIGVLAGFVMVIVALAGLVLIFNALGLSDASSALGLPSGSIRALLALSLVTVFVGVCSADLLDPKLINADAGKQILSISATALTTIIGFYFGSNSANEAFSAANQAASAASGSPPTLGDLQTQAASVEAIADGLKQKLDAAMNPDPDRIAQQNPDAAALAALRNQLASVVALVTAAGVDRDRAANLVKDATTDASKLAGAAAPMQQYCAEAAKAQAAFGPALTAYTTARDALLATLAQG